MIANEFPHRDLHPLSLIWQVGCGAKQALSAVQSSKDVKVPKCPFNMPF